MLCALICEVVFFMAFVIFVMNSHLLVLYLWEFFEDQVEDSILALLCIKIIDLWIFRPSTKRE